MVDVSDDKHGRTATRPAAIPLRGWVDIVWRVARRLKPDQLGLIAAGVAFYGLLSVFPAIAALMALAGLVTDPEQVVAQLGTFAEVMPEQAANILLTQAQLVAGSSDNGLSLTFFLGLGFAIYLSTRATTSLIHGVNVAYAERESRGFFLLWATVIVLTLSMLIAALVLAMLLVGLPAAIALLPWGAVLEGGLSVARWIIAALVFCLGLSLLYRWGPSRRRAKWRWLTVGTVFAAILFFAGSAGFTIYVANFANYNETFGSLGGVIILLTWMWLSSFVVLIGALLDAEIEAQTARDTTVGPDLPLGERGAVKANELGETLGGE
ncbi:MAG: YihY/virulence factor BrkB family protein [Pseudomonadota bacterium]